MKEYQIQVTMQNGKEILSKWMPEEDSLEIVNMIISKASSINFLNIGCEDGSLVIVMQEILKNSLITVRERDVNP